MQASASTAVFPELCCSDFPARLAQPIPIFLSAPPKPVASCPLKCVRLTTTSASITARPIFASFRSTPLRTGTATSSVPLRPSAMSTGQPADSGEKPFSQAVSRCSSACLRLPGYRVFASVRNGRPPISFTRSATAFA